MPLQFDKTCRHQRVERAAKRGKREHGRMRPVMSVTPYLAHNVPSCRTPKPRETHERHVSAQPNHGASRIQLVPIRLQPWCVRLAIRPTSGRRIALPMAFNPLPPCTCSLSNMTLARNSLSYAARGAK